MKGALKRELTESTATEFVGISRASLDINVQMLELAKRNEINMIRNNDLSTQKLNVLLDINNNTAETARHTANLEDIKNSLRIIAGETLQDPVNDRDLGI